NITLFNSSDPDEPFKNQTFSIIVSYRQALTFLRIIYDSFVGWGSNITFAISYINIGDSSDITGADVNATIYLIRDLYSNLVWDSANMTDPIIGFGNFLGNISTDTSVYPYIVTMNTTCLSPNLRIYWEFQVNKTGFSKAVVQAYVDTEIWERVTNITINKEERVGGELIVPQVLEFTNFTYPNNRINYGEDVNFSIFWYDLNSSAYKTGNYNKSGVPLQGLMNLTTSVNVSFAGLPQNILSYCKIYNMYILTGQNESYKGIYNIEIQTSLIKKLYPFQDVIDGGPFNNGTYNFTFNIYYKLIGEKIEYLHTSTEIWLHIDPIEATLDIQNVSLFSRWKGISQEIFEPYVIPFGAPRISNYYFIMKMNYSEVTTGLPIKSLRNYSLSWWNNSLADWQPWESGKYGYYIDKQELRIYTVTDHTEIIPWNGSGYKNVTLLIEFNSTNYESKNLTQTIFLRKHNATIVWCDRDGTEIALTDTATKYFNPDYRIYFRYIDLDNEFDTLATYSDSEKYIRNANISLVGWNSQWFSIGTTSDPNVYYISIEAREDAGEYPIIILASDTHPLAYRNSSIKTFNLTIIPVNSTLTVLYNSFVIYEYELLDFTLHYTDEYGGPISEATITFTMIGASGIAGIFIPLGGGVFKGEVINWALPAGTYLVEIKAEPLSPNYYPITIHTLIVIKGITQHELFFWGMVGVAGLLGFIAYREIKWWIFTPYTVKQIVRTRKIIKKKKEISPESTVRGRKKLFTDHYSDDWTIVNIKPPTMVSTEVVSFAKELSDIRRTRVTTTEAQSLIVALQSQPNLDAADAYLESLMIPPEARRTLLTISGLIKYKKPEVLDFTLLLSEMKGRTYKYDDGEKIYNKLKSLKPSDADSYLWNTHLISVEDRIRLLDTIGISTEKLKKKRRKEVQPMSAKEIKSELRSILGLSVEERRELFEKIKVLTPKDQRKFIGNLRAKQEKREEKRRVKVVEKPKPTGLTAEQIDEELKTIPSLSDEDRKMIKDSILLLDPDEQRRTLDDLKKQYSEK
ncbi:MAG: hypothetical protein ACFFDN_15620, partial [Candidatus Hodarchaeota archaeon]